MKYYAIFRNKNIRKQFSFYTLEGLRESIDADKFLTHDDFLFFENLFNLLMDNPAYEVSMKFYFATYKIVMK